MSQPPVAISNNFMKKSDSVLVDNVSKVYIAFGCCLGINRLTILDVKLAYKVICSIYSLLLSVYMVYLTYPIFWKRSFVVVFAVAKIIQYLSVVFFSSVLWKRIKLYYMILDEFDNELGCRPKTTTATWLVLAGFIIMLSGGIVVTLSFSVAQLIPCHIVYYVEINYFAHLTTLLRARIQMLNKVIKSQIQIHTNKANECWDIQIEGLISHRVKIRQVIDLYSRIIHAHDVLVEATKWQMVIAFTTVFAYNLVGLYDIITRWLMSDENFKKIFVTSVTVCSAIGCELGTMVAACLGCDHVRAQVLTFRELLSSLLYDGKLDKKNRDVVRAALDLSVNHELSFSLLHMVDLSISVPFTVIELLMTYLVILLQFQKIIAVAFQSEV